VVGVHRVVEQRHVAEEIVEDIGLDDVVELLGLPEPHRDREAPVGEVREERIVGNEARHRDDPPARRPGEAAVHLLEVRDAAPRVEPRDRLDPLRARVARHELRLALEEAPEQRVLRLGVGGPVLLHRVVGRGLGVIAAEVRLGFGLHTVFALFAFTRSRDLAG